MSTAAVARILGMHTDAVGNAAWNGGDRATNDGQRRGSQGGECFSIGKAGSRDRSDAPSPAARKGLPRPVLHAPTVHEFPSSETSSCRVNPSSTTQARRWAYTDWRYRVPSLRFILSTRELLRAAHQNSRIFIITRRTIRAKGERTQKCEHSDVAAIDVACSSRCVHPSSIGFRALQTNGVNITSLFGHYLHGIESGLA